MQQWLDLCRQQQRAHVQAWQAQKAEHQQAKLEREASLTQRQRAQHQLALMQRQTELKKQLAVAKQAKKV